MKSLSYHLVSALLLAGMSSVAYAQPSRPNPSNFAQQQQQVAATVSQIQLANVRAQLLQQQSAQLKQQELEQHNRQAQTEGVQAERERARQQADQYRAQKAELQAELRNNRDDQHQAALAKEQLLAALQRQQQELIHQRSAATDLSTQEKLDAQMRQITQESQELQTVQSR